MYILKRFIINRIVHLVGASLPRKSYIANMSMIPLLGEHITLIELYRSHPLAAKYVFAYIRTRSLRKQFLAAQGEEKEKIRKRWLEKAHAKTRSFTNISDGLVRFESAIGDFFIALKNYLLVLFTRK
jgi:hypothetical protein